MLFPSGPLTAAPVQQWHAICRIKSPADLMESEASLNHAAASGFAGGVMREYVSVVVDHKLSALQNQRTTYVHKLTALDPEQDGEHIATYLKLIEDVNAAMVRVSRALAPRSAL